MKNLIQMLIIGVLLGGVHLSEARAVKANPLSKADYSRLKQEINWLMSQYVEEVEKGRTGSPRAKGLRYKFMLLWDAKPMTDAGGTAYFLDEVAGNRIDYLAFTIANERAENRLTHTYESSLLKRINRIITLPEKLYLRRLPEVLVHGQLAVVYQRTRIVRLKAVNSIQNGAPVKEAVAEVEAEWAKWGQRVGAANLEKNSLYYEMNRAIEARLAREVRAKREQESANIEIALELKRMKKEGSDEMYYLEDYKNAYRERLRECASALLKEQLEKSKQSAKAVELTQELEHLVESTPFLVNGSFSYLSEAATKERQEIEKKLIPFIVAKTENSAEAQELQKRLDGLTALNPQYAAPLPAYYGIDYTLQYTWQRRAHEAAYRLLDARQNAPEKIRELTGELEKFAKLGGIPAASFLEWAKIRRDAGQPMLTAENISPRFHQ